MYHELQNCCSCQKYDAGIFFCRMLAMLTAIILSSSHVGRAFMLVSIVEARSTKLEISAVSDLMCLGREVNDLLALFYFPRSCKRLVCQKLPWCRLSYCCYGGKKVYTREFVWSQLLRWLSQQRSLCSSHRSPPTSHHLPPFYLGTALSIGTRGICCKGKEHQPYML